VDELDRMQAEARSTVDRLQDALASLGLTAVAGTPNPWGVGLGVAWSSGDFCVLSVGLGAASLVNIASAVLRGVNQDRLAILDAANRLTRENALFPCVLHDSDVGWDVIMMQRFPAQLLVGSQGFLRQCVQALPVAAAQAVDSFSEVGGRRPVWDGADFDELVTRSML
jgi:hypothetical protein